MIRMQRLSKTFEEQHPDIKLKWVVLEENVLRQRLTTDIATKGGQFDVLTIGMYEASLWGAKGWLKPMKDLPASYDLDDVFPSVRDGLSVTARCMPCRSTPKARSPITAPTCSRHAGLTMPERPTWTQISEFADKLTDKDKEQYGICLRGKAGWGENMALITTVANSYGARWFDEQWKPQFDRPRVEKRAEFLHQHHEKGRPSRRLQQRFQRKPGAVQQRQMRDLGRCQRCRLIRHRQVSEQGQRQRRLHLRAP
jgi:sorbitol/mannitol transport system substrate-binding protein